MSQNNSYFASDAELEETAKRVVNELYNNKDISELKNNGRTLTGNLGLLIERQISDIYSNIEGQKSLQRILINSIRYAVLVEKNTALENEFKKLREACERRKNILLVLERKLETDKNNKTIKDDIDKTKEEIKLLDEQLGIIATKNSEPPTIKKNILDLAKTAYKYLLRSDKTSEKFYIFICKYLDVKIDKNHFGYNVYNTEYQNNSYQNNSYQNKPRFNYNRNNDTEKPDIYIPPALRYNYPKKHF